MNLQSSPAGQQSTAIADESSRRHLVGGGQQKSDGKGVPHCERDPSPPQTGLSSVSRRWGLDRRAVYFRVLVPLDERASSSVALLDAAGICIAAAVRLETEQHIIKDTIKALVAMACEGKNEETGKRR
jgi:hypothetical protein